MARNSTRVLQGVPPTEAQIDRWGLARDELEGLPDGRGLNIAFEAVDRHTRGADARRTALRCLGANGTVTDVSYGELARRSSRAAHALESLGVQPGDRVFLLLGRTAALYEVAHGAS